MINSYPHLISLVFNQPHLCTPEYADTVVEVLRDKISGGVIEKAELPDKETSLRESITSDGVFIMPILGSMTHRASFLDAASGMKSYQSIQKDIQWAVENPNVKSILLEMDSPGGTVSGAFDLRDYIMSIRGTKPIVAIAKDTMASAAYLIGSACDKVYTTQTGKVGSIGVIGVHMDKSKQLEDMGVKPTVIKAGKYKDSGTDMRPLDKDSLEYLQNSVNQSYEMFVDAVAEARGLDKKVIKDTEARVYNGKESVALGLTDGVRTMESVMSELVSQKRVNYQKGNLMEKETDVEQLSAELEAIKTQLGEYRKMNEALTGVVIKEGYKVTQEGIVKTEPQEQMEIEGEMVNKADIPAPVLKALEAAEKERLDRKLSEDAKTTLPNFKTEVAMEFLKLSLSEDAMQTLKAADSMFESLLNEKGEINAGEDIADHKAKLDKMVADYAKEHNVTKQLAFAKVSQTKEGLDLINKSYNEKG